MKKKILAALISTAMAAALLSGGRNTGSPGAGSR